jgi:hypothetical protein
VHLITSMEVGRLSRRPRTPTVRRDKLAKHSLCSLVRNFFSSLVIQLAPLLTIFSDQRPLKFNDHRKNNLKHLCSLPTPFLFCFVAGKYENIKDYWATSTLTMTTKSFSLHNKCFLERKNKHRREPIRPTRTLLNVS